MSRFQRHCYSGTLILLGFLFSIVGAMAADDVVTLTNGDVITGEIKKLNKADLHIDPDYGENIFIVDWIKVSNIQSSNFFVIETSTRQRFTGTIKTDPLSGDHILIQTVYGSVSVPKSSIVYLNPVKRSFWGRLDLAFDFGFGLTAAKGAKKLNARAKAAYVNEKWSTGIQYDTLYDIQKDATSDTESKITRSELKTDYRRDISGKWFALGLANFLESSELGLNLRTTLGSGVGNYIVRNNRWQLSASGGANWTNEKYKDPATETKDSAEAFAGIDFEIFNIGDLDILSSYKVIPSLTESGRLRMDLKTDFRWEFVKDLYFRIGFSNNYDNRPPEGTKSNDYVLDVAVGWSY